APHEGGPRRARARPFDGARESAPARPRARVRPRRRRDHERQAPRRVPDCPGGPLERRLDPRQRDGLSMSLDRLLGLAPDALTAQSFALDVVGQNVSNVNTPGYVRRDANLETQKTGGVVALGVDRAVDRFVDARVYDATGYASGADARDGQLAGIESLFED